MASIQTTSIDDPTSAAVRMTTWICAVVSALVFVSMAAWTWQSCPDPLVDFGREVYIPWRITQGEHLYRDIAHFNGPLSQYFNACVFKVFGASLTTIKTTNFVVAGCMLAMIFAIGRTLCDEWAALVASVCFCIFFAFNQTTGNANFNWLTPYSHELTHGITLAIAMICCLHHVGTHASRKWLIISGFLMGLILLTKAEVIVASAGGALAMLVQPSHGAHVIVKRLVTFIAAMIVPVVIAFALLSTACGATVSARGLLGSFGYIGNTRLLSMTYFRWIGGGADQKMVVEGFVWLALYVVLIGLVWLVARIVRAKPTIIVVSAIICGLIGYAITYYLWRRRMIERIAFIRSAPLILLGLLVMTILQRRPPIERALLIFAGVLLIKIRYNVQPSHYGFALAVPAMVTLVVLVQRRMTENLNIQAWLPRAMLIGILAQPAWLFLRLDDINLQSRTVKISQNSNVFFADALPGIVVQQLLTDLDSPANHNKTLAVMPEGLLINFLSHKKLPVPDTQWTPPALAMFDEEKMLASLKAHPPDLIVVTRADTSIYDARFFGVDYAQGIRSWIDTAYEVKHQYGAAPSTSDKFGAMLLERKTAP